MKKAHRQERLLSSTLTESLILFLFILLAIADIYAKREKIFKEQGLIPPGHKAIPENLKTIDEDQLAVEKSYYKELQDKEEKFDKIVGEKDKEIESLRKKIENPGGVSAPPCIFNDGSQIFFEVKFLPGKKYHLKFKNPASPITFNGVTVYNGRELFMSHNEFKKFGNAVVESKRINKDLDFCCCDAPPKNLSSSTCTECVYVYEHIYVEEKKFSFKSRLDGRTTAEMIKTVDRYFYRNK